LPPELQPGWAAARAAQALSALGGAMRQGQGNLAGAAGLEGLPVARASDWPAGVTNPRLEADSSYGYGLWK